MTTMTDLKKALAPLGEQQEKLSKSKRFETDTEKVATALLTEPAETIAKSDDDGEDADELVKGLTKRVTAIRDLLEKAEEDAEGRTFVTTDADDALAKEFEVEKAGHLDDEEDEEFSPKRKKTKKSVDDDADFDYEDPDEPEWPADLTGKTSRVRKRTTRERVVSTDPSQRKRQRLAKREARLDKLDRVRANRAARANG